MRHDEFPMPSRYGKPTVYTMIDQWWSIFGTSLLPEHLDEAETINGCGMRLGIANDIGQSRTDIGLAR